jgi:glycosyltransferase involved in cell wall biosynthesis
MKVAILTDAWRPQVNGVVTTLIRTGEGLGALGHEVRFLGPDSFRTVPCPTYPEIRLSLLPNRRLHAWLDEFDPDAVHIATEGPLGLAMRRAMIRRGLRFTTSYHTQFPQYLRARIPMPLAWSYGLLRWFHGRAERVMVNTDRVRRELEARGFSNLVHWGRGVDTALFRPRDKSFLDLPRPVFAYAGRVAVEKNIEAFLSLDLPGTRLVIGDGPAMQEMQARYPDVVYTGYRFGEALAATLASADVFVFPSRTDTFGLVMLEAMSCGLPVAAYPVTGPIDVVRDGLTGILHEDLRRAALEALKLDPAASRAQALENTWETATRQFEGHLAEARADRPRVSSPIVSTARPDPPSP